MMFSLRESINLFYYNIFRFERFTQYLAFYPVMYFARITGLEKTITARSGKEDWDTYILSVLNNPKGGVSFFSSGIHASLLIFLLLLTLLNCFCVLFQLELDTFWFYGMVICVVLAEVVSHYVFPTKRREYLADFRKFELLPKEYKRKSALVTLTIVIGIWAVFISSFVFYLKATIN